MQQVSKPVKQDPLIFIGNSFQKKPGGSTGKTRQNTNFMMKILYFMKLFLDSVKIVAIFLDVDAQQTKKLNDTNPQLGVGKLAVSKPVFCR